MLNISAKISSSQSAALLHCLPLIPSKPLGALIRKPSALMFGPLADPLYLWVVWEEAEVYIHKYMIYYQIYNQMCISNTAPPPKKRNTHAQTCRVSHTAGGMRGATAFRTGAPQIEVASNSPVLKAAFLQVAKRLAAFFTLLSQALPTLRGLHRNCLPKKHIVNKDNWIYSLFLEFILRSSVCFCCCYLAVGLNFGRVL